MSFKILYFIDSLSNYKSGVHVSLLKTCEVMHNNGHDVTLIGGYDIIYPSNNHEFKTIGFKVCGLKSFNYLKGLSDWLKTNINNFDLVSIHTIWSFSNYYIVKACLNNNVPFIVTPHGMLHKEALKISSFKKKLAQYIFLKDLFSKSSGFQALNEFEKTQIQLFGINTNIFLVGNGIDLPEFNFGYNNFPKSLQELDLSNKIICLYIGRLHPIKGIDLLIKAWNDICKHPNWHLIIAGDGDEKYVNYLKSIVSNSSLDSISFVGYVENVEKFYYYDLSSFCILPSLSEAFPMAVLESFAYSKPVLITNGCVFVEAIQSNAVIQVESSVQGIKAGLLKMFASEDLVLMGVNGNLLVKKLFSWENIYDKLFFEYRSICLNNDE
jgi:glycosyltransferase involved in cell wall biosynthesis